MIATVKSENQCSEISGKQIRASNLGEAHATKQRDKGLTTKKGLSLETTEVARGIVPTLIC